MRDFLQTLFSLILIAGLLHSCNPNPGVGGQERTAGGGGGGTVGDQRPHTLSSVSIQNDQLFINGERLNNVSSVRLTGPNGFSETLSIESKGYYGITANFQRSVKLLVGKVFNLIISDAAGAASYVLTVQLGGSSGLNQIGTWNASTNTPSLASGGANTSPSGGDYYVVSTTGTTSIDGNSTWSAGDWILYDNALLKWKRIEISNTVSTVFGRSGSVVAATNDYTWAQINKTTSSIDDLSNVDLTGNATNKALVWNGTNFVPTTILLGSGNQVTVSDMASSSVNSDKIADGTIVTADLADNSVTSAKIVDGTIAAGDLASGSVTSAKILDGTIATGDIADGSITSAKLAAGAISTAGLANDSVDMTKLANLTDTYIIVGTSGDPNAVAVSGDATLANTGALSLATGAVTSTKILDGTILNADINASANIDLTKVGTGIVSTTEFNYLDGLTEPISTTIANRVNKAGDTMTGSLAMGTNSITGTGNIGAGSFTSSGQSGFILEDTGASAGELRFMEVGAGTDYVAFKAPTSVTTSATYTLPSAAPGSNGEVLSSTTAGVLSWSTVTTGTVTSVGSGNGLTGGPITSTGSLAVDVATSADVTAGTANKILDATEYKKLAVTTMGVSAGATSLGTFTGSTIADNSSVKTSLQSLETSLEQKQPLDNELTLLAARTTAEVNRVIDIGALTATSNAFIVGNGSTWALNSSNTVRGILGLEVGADYTVPTCVAGDFITSSNGTSLACNTPAGGVSSVFTRTGAVVAANGDYTASQVTNVAAGNISSITVQTAINELDTEKQPLDAQLTDVAGLTPTDSNFIVGNGTNFVAESGATARTSLGLGTTDSPTFLALTGTNSITSSSLRIDATGYYQLQSGNPILAFDANDYLQYNRTSNSYAFNIGGSPRLSIDSSGNIAFNSYGAGTLVTDASGNITASSDERLKRDIASYDVGLQSILRLHPKTYKWNEQSGNETNGTYAGFIAQDVEKVIPYAVFEGKNGMLSLMDRPIMAALVNATKEQQLLIEKNKKMFQAMQGKWEGHERRIASLEKGMELLKEENEWLKEELIQLKNDFQELKNQLKK